MNLRQQLGAMAAHVFRRPLRVQQFFEQLADARITVHRVPPADDMRGDRVARAVVDSRDLQHDWLPCEQSDLHDGRAGPELHAGCQAVAPEIASSEIPTMK